MIAFEMHPSIARDGQLRVFRRKSARRIEGPCLGSSQEGDHCPQVFLGLCDHPTENLQTCPCHAVFRWALDSDEAYWYKLYHDTT